MTAMILSICSLERTRGGSVRRLRTRRDFQDDAITASYEIRFRLWLRSVLGRRTTLNQIWSKRKIRVGDFVDGMRLSGKFSCCVILALDALRANLEVALSRR